MAGSEVKTCIVLPLDRIVHLCNGSFVIPMRGENQIIVIAVFRNSIAYRVRHAKIERSARD